MLLLYYCLHLPLIISKTSYQIIANNDMLLGIIRVTKTVPKIQKPYEFHYISGMIYYKLIENYHSQEMFSCI